MPAIYRSLVNRKPTILLDEYDTYFGSKVAREHAEDLRGLLNAGHRRGKPVLRCVGPSSTVQEFPCFAPVCLAGIRGLPDTIEDRSVIIDMRRRRQDEPVAAFRALAGWNEAEPIREHFAAWADLNDGRWPSLGCDASLFPAGVTDRAADVWEPLLAIGAWAGQEWSQRARQAATHFVSNKRVSDESEGIRLLRDIRLVWPADEQTSSPKTSSRGCATWKKRAGEHGGNPPAKQHGTRLSCSLENSVTTGSSPERSESGSKH